MAKVINPLLQRWEFRGSLIAGVALLVTSAGFVFYPRHTYPSYLIGYLFWVGLTLGCLPLVMLHHLTAGRWGFILRPFFYGELATLPLMALLVLPIFFGLKYLYPWAGLPITGGAEMLKERAVYLNAPAVIVRAILSFAIWLGLAWLLVWRGPSRVRSFPAQSRFQLISGIGLVLFVVVTSFTVIDWLMAIEPTWYSSIFPAIVLNGQVLCALALAFLLCLRRSEAKPIESEQLNRISNLLFAFVLMWTYLSVSQLIIIYAGNLPHEIVWYRHRTSGNWLWIALFLVTFQFILPFILLLFRGVKKSAKTLTAITAMQLTVQAVAMFWYTAPAYRHTLRLDWTDPVTFVGIGAAWAIVFGRQVRREPQSGTSAP